jgi:SAM-dependent methyltransferase
MSELKEAFSQLHDVLVDRRFPALEPDYYLRAHALFRSCTDEQSLIVDWLSRWMIGHRHHERSPMSLSVLSIGCGDGSIDAQVVDHLMKNSAQKLSVIYVGIEPNVVSPSTFLHRLSSSNSVAVSVIKEKWPECVTELVGQSFDFILCVHSLYQIVDTNSALENALRLLKPQGQLIILLVRIVCPVV